MAVRRATCFVGEGLGPLLGEAALGQTLDEAMSVGGDGLDDDPTIALTRSPENARAVRRNHTAARRQFSGIFDN